jgi:hypothetical protein
MMGSLPEAYDGQEAPGRCGLALVAASLADQLLQRRQTVGCRAAIQRTEGSRSRSVAELPISREDFSTLMFLAGHWNGPTTLERELNRGRLALTRVHRSPSRTGGICS